MRGNSTAIEQNSLYPVCPRQIPVKSRRNPQAKRSLSGNQEQSAAMREEEADRIRNGRMSV